MLSWKYSVVQIFTIPVVTMKHTTHARNIRDIKIDRFSLIYFSEEQVQVYKAHRHDHYTKIIIDATGSLVARLPRPHGNLSGHIYLYEALLHFGKKQVPCFQMLSEENDMLSIKYWLERWLLDVVRGPQEVVCDGSKALLGAAARAFGQCKDLNQYQNKCFLFVKYDKGTLPPCFIRQDVAHLINACRKWDVWTVAKKHTKLKEFFLRCLGLLIKARSFSLFEDLLRKLLVICFSVTDGVDINGNKTRQSCIALTLPTK